MRPLVHQCSTFFIDGFISKYALIFILHVGKIYFHRLGHAPYISMSLFPMLQTTTNCRHQRR
uniref:Uncharacterized protein n=1 Tax=Arion vulgaris TaxID=1028688 RepID=A0A0B7B5H0_9EUPU